MNVIKAPESIELSRDFFISSHQPVRTYLRELITHVSIPL